MSFTTLAAVKEALRISGTADDALITTIVAAVNAELLDFFHLDACASQQYTLSYDVLDEVRGIWLHPYPVISADTVVVDGVTLTAGEYYLEARNQRMGMLMRKDSGAVASAAFWPVGPQIAVITHTAGWASGTPDPSLVRAGTLLAVYAYNTEAKLGFVSERIGQYSYKLGSGIGSGQGAGGAEAGGWPAPVARILSQWVRPFAEGA